MRKNMDVSEIVSSMFDDFLKVYQKNVSFTLQGKQRASRGLPDMGDGSHGKGKRVS
jgi:hypothetical protein